MADVMKGKLIKYPINRRLNRMHKYDWQLWVLLVPALLFFIIFHYLPIYGIQIAFRDYKAVFGITGSKWVGFKNFADFFKAYYFGRLVLNTFLLNIFGLLWSFPIPIIMAILINQLGQRLFRRFVQTTIYIPHFISTVVMVGMLHLFLSPTNGIVNKLIEIIGLQPIYFMAEPSWFRTLFIGSDIWQHTGWNTILYIATLTGVDPELYEAATVDGANKLQKIWHIDIPHLLPIAIMMLILNCGHLLVSNTDKALLMKTAANSSRADIIGVYVYEMGLGKAQFSYTAAIGLFTNVINFITILIVNSVSKKISETSLF
jgi:putative aldouronate transport system permease protein